MTITGANTTERSIASPSLLEKINIPVYNLTPENQALDGKKIHDIYTQLIKPPSAMLTPPD